MARRAEFVASLFHTITKGLFGFLEVAAWIIAFLIANFAVDLEHAFDIFTHVGNDRA